VADRSVALTTVKGGINRQRTKGGALQDSLYDLINGYVTKSKTVFVRPGTFRFAELPTNTAGEGDTKGLMAFRGELHVFSHHFVDVPDGIVLHVIQHPTDPTSPIAEINFAAPFMGFPYVVATFENGDTWHFWLQDGDAWQADHIYKLGDIVTPSVPNGFSYQAGRLLPANTMWAPNVQRTVGDVVEPTVYNDFFYTVVDTQGANPRSGDVEPIWPTEDGARINEDAEGTSTVPPSVTEPPDAAALPSPGIRDRYSNGPGRFG
jgi:hypothetical protein